MFSRKTRKLSVAILMFIIAVSFSFCIINNCKTVNVNANVIEVDNISIDLPSWYEVYEFYPNEVYPALPLQGELWSNNQPTGQIVELTWYTDCSVTQEFGTRVYTYTANFDVPDGYHLVDGYAFPTVPVAIIDDYRPMVTSLYDCTENVSQNQEYTLPETLKGMVEGVDEFVDIAVTWDSVANTTESGIKVYTATAVNSYNYKVPDIENITAKLTLIVGNTQSPTEIKQYYQKGETFKSMEMGGYTFLGWAKADNASLGVYDAGTAVTLEGYYFAILAKLEYLGISFRVYEQGVRFGFVLKFYGLDNDATGDNLKTSFVDTLIKTLLEKAMFTATIYNREFNYTYTEVQLKYEFLEEYQGYVSNLVFAKIADGQLDESVKVDAYFAIASKLLSAEGKTCTIRAKAQEAYEKTKFDVEDQATADKMAQMYGVEVKKG